MRRIFIGDVHGCYEQLIALLDAIKLDRENDELIFVGDYIDRGPASYEVVMLLKELKETMGDRCTLLRGNHEKAVAESHYEVGDMNLNTVRRILSFGASFPAPFVYATESGRCGFSLYT